MTLLVGFTSNAVNLTDGLDGLAGGLGAIATATFALIAYITGRVDTSAYLGLFYLPGAGEMAIFALALAGGILGFLWYNAHPAQVFMGDTGSLAIGGALAVMAILLKAEFLLLIIGGRVRRRRALGDDPGGLVPLHQAPVRRRPARVP